MKRSLVAFLVFAVVLTGMIQADRGLNNGDGILPKNMQMLQRSRIRSLIAEKYPNVGTFREVIRTLVGPNHREIKRIDFPNGKSTIRIQHLYNGIPVLGSEIALNIDTKNKRLLSKTGFIFRLRSSLDTTPNIKLEDAVKLATNTLGTDAKLETIDGELAIHCDDAGEYLVWSFILFDGGEIRWQFLVDAHDSSIRVAYNLIQTTNGTVALMSDGEATGTTVTFDCTQQSFNNYELVSTIAGTEVQTWDMNNGSFAFQADIATDTSTNWSDMVIANAHHNAEQVLTFYDEVCGLSSFNDNNATLKVYVHLKSNYDNAYWNGSAIYFGDGSYVNGSGYFTALCVLDVLGHEFTHAVTQNHSDLIYANESGAMNEALSDIMGVAIEFWYKNVQGINTVCDWEKVGEECTPANSDIGYDALRHMNDPTISGLPKYYQGENWYSGNGDNGGVHTNCGVGNYAFYLMAQEMGVLLAAKIFHTTNVKYLVASSTYEDWGAACQLAVDNDISASDLQAYGNAANLTKTIVNNKIEDVWATVGLPMD